MQKQIIDTTTPIIIAPETPTNPAAGVIAANPAIAPVLMPITVGFLSINQSNSTQVMAAVAPATCVTISAFTANPSAANPLPALNPNQPTQRRPAPITT